MMVRVLSFALSALTIASGEATGSDDTILLQHRQLNQKVGAATDAKPLPKKEERKLRRAAKRWYRKQTRGQPTVPPPSLDGGFEFPSVDEIIDNVKSFPKVKGTINVVNGFLEDPECCYKCATAQVGAFTGLTAATTATGGSAIAAAFVTAAGTVAKGCEECCGCIDPGHQRMITRLCDVLDKEIHGPVGDFAQKQTTIDVAGFCDSCMPVLGGDPGDGAPPTDVDGALFGCNSDAECSPGQFCDGSVFGTCYNKIKEGERRACYEDHECVDGITCQKPMGVTKYGYCAKHL